MNAKKKIRGAQTVDGYALQEQLRREIELENQARSSSARASALKRKYEEQQKELELAHAQIAAIESIESSGTKPSVIEPTTPTGKGEAIPLLMCADWHPYEVVKKSQVNNLNEYNPAICHKSVETLFKSFLRLVEIERAGTNVNQCVVAILGDIIGNMIHEDQVENNAGTPQEEELFVIFDLLIPGLQYLAEHGNFQKIYVKCSHGNHDRGTTKKQFVNVARHSHAWVVYQVIRRWFENTKYARVFEFDIAEGYHLYYNVFGHTIRQHHGDAFKYNGGIGGPTISVKRGIAQWEQGKVIVESGIGACGHADMDIFGHLHTTFGDTTFFAGPSLIGYSEFSIANKLPYEPPAQRMILLDKKRWITSDRRIYVR